MKYIFFLFCLVNSSVFAQVGTASLYADRFQGQKTTSGERYNPSQATAAHSSLPLGTKVQVTNLETNKSTVVRINDRGAYGRHLIDLSRAAAQEIGLTPKQGACKVKIKVLK